MQVGDKVKSRDPQTGQESAKTITAAVKRIAPAVVTVTLTDAKTGKTEALTCTPEHPFFVQGQGWVEAGSLGIGTSIVSRAGPALSVTNVTWKRDKSKELAAGSSASTQGGYTVYNLTVEDDHTFFVGTTGGGTWVHNADCADAAKDNFYLVDHNIPKFGKVAQPLQDMGYNSESVARHFGRTDLQDQEMEQLLNDEFGDIWNVISKDIKPDGFTRNKVIHIPGGNSLTSGDVINILTN